jgi:anti-sigma-K factor RskA
MVRLTETDSWQRAAQTAREVSRWDLADEDVERHLSLAYDYVVGVLSDSSAEARQLDPSGEAPLASAKMRRREALRQLGRRDRSRLQELAEQHFGPPARELRHWHGMATRLPWRAPESILPWRRLLAASDG